MKKIFKIPVTWEAYGVVEIEAESLTEALQIFDKTESTIELPYDSEYVDGSFRREDFETCKLFNTHIVN